MAVDLGRLRCYVSCLVGAIFGNRILQAFLAIWLVGPQGFLMISAMLVLHDQFELGTGFHIGMGGNCLLPLPPLEVPSL